MKGFNTENIKTEFKTSLSEINKAIRKMSINEYERLILEKHKDKIQFDKQICREAGIKDIDWEFVKKGFVPLYEKATGKNVIGRLENILESLNCIKENKPTNAGILLFGKDPQKYFMNAYIALARYATPEVDVRRLDYKEFTGNLFQQIDSCERYIKENISVMSVLTKEKVWREDIPEYGWFTIRELVTNAVCHRDYSNIGTKIIVNMFSDRIDIYNPGGLSHGITTKNITEVQYSRNPIISKILAKAEYIEELGEGWNKILKEHKEHSLKPKMPDITSDNFAFTVTIYSTKSKFVEGKKEKADGFNDRQRKIINYLKNNTQITTIKCARLLRISSDTAFRELGVLLGKKVIQRHGIGRGIYYSLANNPAGIL